MLPGGGCAPSGKPAAARSATPAGHGRDGGRVSVRDGKGLLRALHGVGRAPSGTLTAAGGAKVGRGGGGDRRLVPRRDRDARARSTIGLVVLPPAHVARRPEPS